MSGAIIPDDWDGSTYKCYRVEWPQSEQYEAILLGNISKPSYLDYWDPETGDAQDAANAIKGAYNQTLPDFWAEDCEDPVLSTKSFRVRNSVTQALPAATWTKVLFDEFVWNYEPFTWNLAENAQDLTIPASAGIWQYNANIVTDDDAQLSLALLLNNYYYIAVSRASSSNDAMINGAWDVDASWTWLNLWAYSSIATTIATLDDAYGWLEGHLIRPIEGA